MIEVSVKSPETQFFRENIDVIKKRSGPFLFLSMTGIQKCNKK
jgi:hypothetical protein